jgi:hypothetical protein
MTALVILIAILAIPILFRWVRFLAMIALVVAFGYLAHGWTKSDLHHPPQRTRLAE